MVGILDVYGVAIVKRYRGQMITKLRGSWILAVFQGQRSKPVADTADTNKCTGCLLSHPSPFPAIQTSCPNIMWWSCPGCHWLPACVSNAAAFKKFKAGKNGCLEGTTNMRAAEATRCIISTVDPAAAYYFRLVYQNAVGTTEGEVTAAIPPLQPPRTDKE